MVQETLTRPSSPTSYKITNLIRRVNGMATVFIEYSWLWLVSQIQLWDTLGMERYAPLTRSHYSNSKIILLVYDSDDMDSLECLESIYDEAIEHAVGADMVLVRNQIDKEMQMVDEDEAFLKLCRGTGGQRQRILASHMATSAKTGQGIAELRTELGNLLSGAEPVRPGTGRFLEDSRDEPTQNSTSTRPSKSCC